MDPFEEQNNLHYSLNRYLRLPEKNEALLHEITDGYSTIHNKLSGTPTSRFILNIPTICLADYAATPYKDAIRAIQEYAQVELAPYLHSFFVHGSLADMRYAEGFSDLDTYLFIKSDICTDPNMLDQLRSKLVEAQKILSQIDPNSHHGFILSNEIDLSYYCGAYMPIPVFRSAKSLLGPVELVINLRDSHKEYEESFVRFATIISNKERFDRHNLTPYELKYFIAVLLLMPSLYLQACGEISYKRFSFESYHHPFLEKLSRARLEFNKRTTAEIISILGPEHFQAAMTMLDDMRNKFETYRASLTTINWPRPMPISTYDDARKELSKHFMNLPEVSAIYEYGNVRAPGISDLDLIVVTKSDLYRSKSSDFSVSGPHFSAALKVAPSTLMVMPRDVFEHIHRFDDLIKLKLVCGEEINTVELSPEEQKIRAIASIVDWLPERIARLIAIYHKQELDAQYALRYARSFTYSLELVAKVTGDQYYLEYGKEVMRAREGALRGERPDIRDLVRRGIYAGYEALFVFTRMFFPEEMITEGMLTLFPWQKIIFTQDHMELDPDLAIVKSDGKSAVTITPSSLILHFLAYRDADTSLSRQMREQFKVSGNIKVPSNDYYRFLIKKIELADRNASYLRTNGFKGGLFRFGFFFTP